MVQITHGHSSSHQARGMVEEAIQLYRLASGELVIKLPRLSWGLRHPWGCLVGGQSVLRPASLLRMMRVLRRIRVPPAPAPSYQRHKKYYAGAARVAVDAGNAGAAENTPVLANAIGTVKGSGSTAGAIGHSIGGREAAHRHKENGALPGKYQMERAQNVNLPDNSDCTENCIPWGLTL